MRRYLSKRDELELVGDDYQLSIQHCRPSLNPWANVDDLINWYKVPVKEQARMRADYQSIRNLAEFAGVG